MRLFLIFILFLSASFASEIEFKKIVKVDGVVWGMECIDGINKTDLIFTTREGRVGVVELDREGIRYLKNTPKDIFVKGQGGLMDIALSPFFKKTKEIYFTYAKAISGRGATTLAVAKLEGESLESWRDLLTTDSLSSSGIHFGSRIAFDEKYLYFGIGDRGDRDSAQDLSSHKGKILRLNLDGSIPKDNPFFDNDNGIKKEIYSYGHRNPQGLFFDSTSLKLYSNEHGPRGGDEINIIESGKNYGWPIVSLGREYYSNKPIGVTTKEGVEEPIKTYTPSIAPSSLIVYRGDKYKKLQDTLLSSALAGSYISGVKIKSPLKEEVEILKGLGERFRVLKECRDGTIYFGTDSGVIGMLE